MPLRVRRPAPRLDTMTRQRLRRSKGSNRRWALGVDRASSLLGRRCTPSWCAVSMNLAGCSVGPRRRCGERTPFAGDLRGRRNLGGYHRRDYRRLTPRCGARPFAFWVGWGPKSEPGVTSRVQEERGQTVISTGPYAAVRHPMYAYALLLFIGTPLLLGSH